MQEILDGVRRVTFRLPLGIDHVHCYLLRSDSGGWTLVDTGLGDRDPEAVWGPVLANLDGPVERIVVTHMHPDHVGGARDAAAVTGARVLQGREDYEQCVLAWGPERSGQALADYMVFHGMPRAQADEYMRESARLLERVHWFEGPELLEPGDEVDGWRVELLRGHADGHIVLHRDGVLIAGDTILGQITPAVGLYPRARPDPLGDYLASLERIAELAPRVALAGHGPTIEDPVARAREILEHHRERLDAAEAALDGEPRDAYQVSLVLFAQELSPSQRRFALAESLAHLERLANLGRATRAGDGLYVGTGTQSLVRGE
jgi:glyoxylase-like metal-dependent hydrolase (beta-lactamase superfamily II)